MFRIYFNSLLWLHFAVVAVLPATTVWGQDDQRQEEAASPPTSAPFLAADLDEAPLPPETEIHFAAESIAGLDAPWEGDPCSDIYCDHSHCTDYCDDSYWGWFPKGQPYERALTRTPDMMGDFFAGESLFVQTNAVVSNFMRADLPVAGASRNVKVSEHNRALPTDRVYFLYNHFHRSLRFHRSLNANSEPFQTEEHDIDRYTTGFEKTFRNGIWSVEMRMPLTNEFQYEDENPLLPGTDFQVAGGDVGNLAVILKRLVYVNEFFALSAGVGVNTPTGSDVEGSLPLQSPPIDFMIHNESIHVLPFIGFTATEGDRWFMHSFIQFDIAARGDRVETTLSGGRTESYIWNDPTLFYFDIGFGYWLHHPPIDDGLITGIAGILEFHYAAPIDGDDQIPLFGAGTFTTPNEFENIGNVSAGLHVELTPRSSLRGGIVVPVESFPDRTFDFEGQASFIRRF